MISRRLNGRPRNYKNKREFVQVNYQEPRRRLRRYGISAGLGVMAFAATAQAAVDFNAEARLGADHNSNVFQRPNDLPPFASTGNTALGDRILRYFAGGTADFSFGLDKLSLLAQGERFDYDRFSTLNHYATRLAAAFDWYLGPRLNGTFNYAQRRDMAPLADTFSEVLEIQSEKTASATLRYALTPRWRLEFQPVWHDLHSPLPLYPEFGYKETSAAGALKYLGIQKLTFGARVEYLDGRYHGIVGATRYHQTTGLLTAEYAVSGFSSFNAQAGYTKRANNSVDNAVVVNQVSDTKAFTGALGFHRDLSVKTSVDFRVFREVESYIAGANSQIGTGGDAALVWKPDVKFTLSVRYRMATQSIQGTLAIAEFNNRTDHVKTGEVDLDYHMFRWLTLRPYFRRDVRSSNFTEANFNATLVGIEVTGHLKEQELK